MDGYKTVKDMTTFNNWTKSFRYKILKLEKNGEFFLFKQANDDFTKQLLKNEVRWREFFKMVDIKNVDNTEIAEEGDDYLLFKWLDAEVLAQRSPESIIGFENLLDRYVDLLVAVMQAGVGYKPDSNEAAAIKPESRFDTNQYYGEGLKVILSAGWIEEEKITKIQALYDKYVSYAQGGYQHGDFTPWHIFTQGEQWFIYDAEHANSLRSRYTDLVHSYNRIACQCKNPGISKDMLAQFLEKSGVDESEFKKAAMPEFIRKAAGSVIDSYNDRREADFRQESMAFLDNVLADDLNRLVS